jgi:hypothetical protein
MRLLFVLFFVAIFSSPALSEEKLPKWVTDAGPQWEPPSGGLVRDKWAAIEIAHAAWFSAWRAHGERPSVDVWEKSFDATLSDGVWEVTEPMKPNEIGGSVFVFVSQKDGRILSMFITQ